MAILAKVEAAVANGARLPRWGWPVPAPYNGATGQERITGWQQLHLAQVRGWMPRPNACSICDGSTRLHMHTENYFRPFLVHPVCQSCHFCLHRRFRHPAAWLALIEAASAKWPATLAMAELGRKQALAAALRPTAKPLEVATPLRSWRQQLAASEPTR